jgi:hypothetical protein
MMIEYGADVNASRRTAFPNGRQFCSPLEAAISNRHEGIAKKLVDAGANLDHRVRGMTMVDYAGRKGCQDFLGHLSSLKSKR